MQLRELFNEFPVDASKAVPLALQQLLRSELNVHEDWERAEQLLLSTRELIPERMEILVALYKMYAYSNRLEESMNLIDEVLLRSAQAGGFTAQWQELTPESAPWAQARGAIRFYLYSLKAKGFVNLRKGNVQEAHAVLTKLCELDVQDQVGGSVVYGMAERLLEQEDE